MLVTRFMRAMRAFGPSARDAGKKILDACRDFCRTRRNVRRSVVRGSLMKTWCARFIKRSPPITSVCCSKSRAAACTASSGVRIGVVRPGGHPAADIVKLRVGDVADHGLLRVVEGHTVHRVQIRIDDGNRGGCHRIGHLVAAAVRRRDRGMAVAVEISGLVDQVDRGGMGRMAEGVADQRAEDGADQRPYSREDEIEHASEQIADRGADADGAADRTRNCPPTAPSWVCAGTSSWPR